MRPTEIARNYTNTHLSKGAFAIDATAGNGHDAATLARAVGPAGRVLVIDNQASALGHTRGRLHTAGLLPRCELLHDDHAAALARLRPEYDNTIRLIIFNLGYLPGGDKAEITTPATTLPALESSRRLLEPNGFLLVTSYSGHPGGGIEARAVAEWMRSHAQDAASVRQHIPESARLRAAPVLWAFQKAPAPHHGHDPKGRPHGSG